MRVSSRGLRDAAFLGYVSENLYPERASVLVLTRSHQSGALCLRAPPCRKSAQTQHAEWACHSRCNQLRLRSGKR